MKVTDVEIRDVMKIKYVQVTPQPGVTVVGGMNEQGKTSFLSAIAMTLGGKRLCPAKPIRAGKDMALIKVKIDGDPKLLLPPSTVIRRFFQREDGTIKSELEIQSDDGYQAPEPQTTLNRLLVDCAFDPLWFTRLKALERAKELRDLVGVDTTALEAQRREDYEQRRLVGREVKQLQGELDGLPPHNDGVPDEPVSAEAILQEMQAARAQNQANDEKRFQANSARAEVHALHDELAAITKEVEELRARIAERQALYTRVETHKLPELERRARAAEDIVSQLQDIDESTFTERMKQIDATNTAIRANEKRKDVATRLVDAQGRYDDFSERLENIDTEMAQLFADAQWPIEGLAFDQEGGVLYNGVPFEQASSAEQLRVSVAIGFALNPSLKLLLIRDGSLLDDNSLAQVAALAEEYGGQVFLERVGEGNECHIVLRDGEMVERTAEEDGAIAQQ